MLRVCASCEWIYKVGKNPGVFKHNWDCPKCNFSSYGARYVFGNKCYTYAKTQQPWMKKKMDDYACDLLEEIDESNKT